MPSLLFLLKYEDVRNNGRRRPSRITYRKSQYPHKILHHRVGDGLFENLSGSSLLVLMLQELVVVIL